MVTLIKILICLSAFSLFASEEESKRNMDLNLEIGESYEIPVREGTSIQISKRGIVDAQILPGKIRIVALKQGLVVVILNEAQKTNEDIRYYIAVKPRTDDLPQALEDIKTSSENSGLSFSETSIEVRGVSKKYLGFYRSKNLCEAKKTCLFSATLSDVERETLKKTLEVKFGEQTEVLISANGSITALTPCSEKVTNKDQAKILEHRLGIETLKPHLLVSCKKDWYGGSYILYSKMLVMESSTAKDIGLQSKFEWDYTTTKNPLDVDLKLHAAIKNKKAELIGEPVIWLLNGVEARAQSGSEVLVLKEDSEKKNGRMKYAWKDVGLDLKVRIFPLDTKKVRLEYSFLMSTPSSDANAIHKNKLESEVELSLEKAAIVGGIQFKTSGKNNGTVAGLDSIPILGPLLRTEVVSDMESNIFLYFYLKKAD